MWYYKNKIISKVEDFGVETPYGFIYIVTHIPTGRKYLGKKILKFTSKKKLTKKEINDLYKGSGRKPKFKSTTKESDWKTYYGSNLEIKQLLKENKHNEFKREIIEFGYSSKHLTYLETKYLFNLKVLEEEGWFNNTILGKFYREDLQL